MGLMFSDWFFFNVPIAAMQMACSPPPAPDKQRQERAAARHNRRHGTAQRGSVKQRRGDAGSGHHNVDSYVWQGFALLRQGRVYCVKALGSDGTF